ncbi:MAG: hypothetical protein ACMG6H_00985 [Acidobacteriota bacterium]
MKKSIPVCLIVLVAVLSGSAQQVEKRRPGKVTILGPARSVRVERSKVTRRNGQSIEGPKILFSVTNYNEDGTRLEQIRYRPDGSISDRINESYDPDGRILESNSFKGNGDPGVRLVYDYDAKKKLIEQTFYRPDGSIANRTSFVYQGNRRLHESVGYDENGIVISRVTGTLDLTTHKIETITQTAIQVLARQTSFTDIPEGQVFEERVNGNQTELDVVRRWGKNGNEFAQYNPDGSVKSRQRSQSVWDSHHNVIRTVLFVSDDGTDNFRPVGVHHVTIEYFGAG